MQTIESLHPKNSIPQTRRGSLLNILRWVNTRLYICDGGLGGIEGVRVEGRGWPARVPKEDGCLPPRWKTKPRQKGGRSENYLEHHARQMRRAKARLRRLAKSNRLRYMWTLTTSALLDAELGDLRIWALSRQLTRRGIPYLIVREYQVRGAVHYHLLTDRFIRWDSMWAWWSPEGFKAYEEAGRKGGWDFVKPVGPKHGSRVGRAAGYLAKYITKGIEDERLQERHSYLRSRALKEPEMIEGSSANFFEMLVWMSAELKSRVRMSGPPETDYIWDRGELQAAGLSPP